LQPSHSPSHTHRPPRSCILSLSLTSSPHSRPLTRRSATAGATSSFTPPPRRGSPARGPDAPRPLSASRTGPSMSAPATSTSALTPAPSAQRPLAAAPISGCVAGEERRGEERSLVGDANGGVCLPPQASRRQSHSHAVPVSLSLSCTSVGTRTCGPSSVACAQSRSCGRAT
jgi:hypothetical protein